MNPSPTNVGIVGLSALGTCYAFGVIVQALLARRWPSVQGEVVSTRAVRRTTDEGSIDYPYVTYRYEVEGRLYRDDRVSFGPQILPSSFLPALDPEPRNSPVAESLQCEFPRGRKVQVFYNPRDPASSVLSRAPNVYVWVILCGAVVFGLAVLGGG